MREQKPPTWINHLGSKKGDGFSGGRKPLKRRHQADGLGGKAPEWRGGEETLERPRERRKALGSETLERWELKEATKGRPGKTHGKRVAKP